MAVCDKEIINMVQDKKHIYILNKVDEGENGEYLDHFETATRNTLDIASVPIIKKYTNLPIIVDPSHAGGLDYLVKPLSLASAAVGADGIIIEVNDKKTEALSDGEQAINYVEFDDLLVDLKKILKAMDKTYE